LEILASLRPINYLVSVYSFTCDFLSVRLAEHDFYRVTALVFLQG
jgi:hypothetical protein